MSKQLNMTHRIGEGAASRVYPFPDVFCKWCDKERPIIIMSCVAHVCRFRVSAVLISGKYVMCLCLSLTILVSMDSVFTAI